jgi:transmembrane sensor
MRRFTASGRSWSLEELQALRLQSLQFLTHLHSGEATEEDLVAILLWRKRSPAHEEAFRSAVRLRGLVRDCLAQQPEYPSDRPSNRLH